MESRRLTWSYKSFKEGRRSGPQGLYKQVAYSNHFIIRAVADKWKQSKRDMKKCNSRSVSVTYYRNKVVPSGKAERFYILNQVLSHLG